ncbi:hypothetical protein KYC5002_08195 [Archangium violaceum]|uniref:hypothetical protein n=1 Tax=Archangium violaceum TaxID=83451 RepID=UPI002B2D45A5|nr:hypothetical protein KYC5002_08195 [Archangium gephyra]
MKRVSKLMRWAWGVGLGAMVFACGPVQDPATDEEARGVPEVVRQVEAAHSQDMPLPEARPLGRRRPAVAYGGGKYLVAWQDVREGGVYATRVKPDGTILDPEGIRLNIDPAVGAGQPAIAYDGRNFIVVWTWIDGVAGVRVKTDGTVLGPVFEVSDSGEASGTAAIACSQKLCLVVFQISGDVEDVYVVRLETDGTVLDPELALSNTDNMASEASVAWDGKEFLVVWSDTLGGGGTRDIRGARVHPDGTFLDGTGGFLIAAAPGEQRTPDVVWTGRRFLVVWSDGRSGERDILGARVRSDGRVDDAGGFPISTAPGDQLFPAVAHHNSKSLVVWEDLRSGSHRIWGARVTESATVTDASGFAISSGDFPAEFFPEVAYGGDRFLAVYAGGSEENASEQGRRFTPHFVLGARVKHDTSVLDRPALILTRSTEAPPPTLQAPPPEGSR